MTHYSFAIGSGSLICSTCRVLKFKVSSALRLMKSIFETLDLKVGPDLLSISITTTIPKFALQIFLRFLYTMSSVATSGFPNTTSQGMLLCETSFLHRSSLLFHCSALIRISFEREEAQEKER